MNSGLMTLFQAHSVLMENPSLIHLTYIVGKITVVYMSTVQLDRLALAEKIASWPTH